MKSLKYTLFIFLISNICNCQIEKTSQKDSIVSLYELIEKTKKKDSIISFSELPEKFQKKILEKIETIKDNENISDEFIINDGIGNTVYSYNLNKQGNSITGNYKKFTSCPSCMIKQDNINYIFQIVRLYCCKDKRHLNQETAKTEEEMRTIQKKNGCKKIGFCNY